MKGVNKVILLGNIGKEPEVKVIGNMTIANFSVATSEAWKDRDTGENKEKTEWHRVVAYKKLAEIVDKYLKKGYKVYIEGKLHTRKWQDKKTGLDRYSTEIIADHIQILGGKDHQRDDTNNKNEQESLDDNSDLFEDVPF